MKESLIGDWQDKEMDGIQEDELDSEQCYQKHNKAIRVFLSTVVVTV